MPLRHAPALVALALAALLAPVPAIAYTECGDKGERACCVHERTTRNPGACKGSLVEKGNCRKERKDSNCECGSAFGQPIYSDGICREKSTSSPAPSLPKPEKASACGGEGQRACCLGEKPDMPTGCGPGTRAVGGCTGDCTCGGPDGNKVLLGTPAISHCEKLASCGAKNDKPCPLDVQIAQKRKSCDAGLVEDFTRNLCVEDTDPVREAMCRAIVAAIKKGGEVPAPLKPAAAQVSQKKGAFARDVRKAEALLEKNKAAMPAINEAWTAVKGAKGEVDRLFTADVLCVKSAMQARLDALHGRLKPQIDKVAATLKPYVTYPGHFHMSYGITASIGAGAGLQAGYVVATDYKGGTGVYAFIGPQVIANASLGDALGIMFYPATTLAGFEGWGGGFGVSGGPFQVVSGGIDFAFTDIGQPIGVGPNIGVGLGALPVDVSASATYAVKLWSTK
jgi:hypothetical protein